MATTWLFCIRCERAFQGDSEDSCHYDDCSGQIKYIYEWGIIRKSNLQYPEIPILGKKYPLYT